MKVNGEPDERMKNSPLSTRKPGDGSGRVGLETDDSFYFLPLFVMPTRLVSDFTLFSSKEMEEFATSGENEGENRWSLKVD